jgi:peptidoglycan/LPS O-acetylase OafA/YrhL
LTDDDGAYLPGLDTLRALAVSAVVVFHLGFSWLPGGYLGVSLFFTLSGFLITHRLLAEHERTGRISLPAFWGRRARRLVPAAWMTIAVVVAMSVAAPGLGRAIGFRGGDAISALFSVANWRFLWNGSSYASLFTSPSPLLHFWSLAIEEQAYLLLPVMLFACSRFASARRALLVAAATGAVVSFALPSVFGLSVDRTYYGTDTRIGEILIGVALAAAWPWVSARFSVARVAAIAPFSIVAFVVLCATIDHGAASIASWLLPVVAVVSCLSVTSAVHPAGLLARAGRTPPVAFIGQASYGIYLFHWPLIVVLRRYDIDTTGIVVAAMAFAAAAVLAGVSLRLIELPIRRRRWPTGRVLIAAATTAAMVVALGIGFAPQPTAADDLLASLESGAQVLQQRGEPTIREAAVVATAPVTFPEAGTSQPTQPPPTAPLPTATTIEPGLPSIRLFGDSILLSLILATPPDRGASLIPVDGDTRLGCGLVEFTEPGDRGANRQCPDPVAGWRSSLGKIPADAAVVMSCQWEAVDRLVPGAPDRRVVGDPAFDAYVLASYQNVIGGLLDGGVHEVLWVRCPRFSQAVGLDTIDDRFVASRSPERVDALNLLIDAAVAAYPGRACVVDIASWVNERVDDPIVRPDGSHFEWRTPTGIGPVFADAIQRAWNGCSVAG